MKLRSLRSSLVILLSATILLTALYSVSRWRPCSGLRDCYLSWNLFWSGSDRSANERQLALSQFAASSKLVAFSIPVELGATGLILFDRQNRRARLIYEEGVEFFAPFLSPDNEQLVLVRRNSSSREIISCSISGWICHSLLQSEGPIRSPVEIDRNTIAYASSPLVVGNDKKARYGRYDIFLKKGNEAPIQVTHLGASNLDPISVSSARILFSVYNGTYDLYSMRSDQARVSDATPVQASKLPLPHNAIIVAASVSGDDRHISFLQAETVQGQANFQYNLHLANTDAATLRTIKVEGIAMSRGVFDQDSLIYNELFEDHYRISKLDLRSNGIEEIAVIRHSSLDMKSLERIKLNVE